MRLLLRLSVQESERSVHTIRLPLLMQQNQYRKADDQSKGKNYGAYIEHPGPAALVEHPILLVIPAPTVSNDIMSFVAPNVLSMVNKQACHLIKGHLSGHIAFSNKTDLVGTCLMIVDRFRKLPRQFQK